MTGLRNLVLVQHSEICGISTDNPNNVVHLNMVVAMAILTDSCLVKNASKSADIN